MAVLATVQFTWLDSEGKQYKSSYTARDSNVDDITVRALADAMQSVSALSLIKCTVSREVDITAESDAVEAGASRQRDASLAYTTSILRASRGQRYTFQLPQIKAALLDAEGRVDPANAAWNAVTEQFDDGAGIAGVVGNFFAGNQGELIEDSDPIEGFQNQN